MSPVHGSIVVQDLLGMSLHLFGYEIPIDACCHCVSWGRNRYGRTYWYRARATERGCTYHQGWWWIIDDVEYYQEKDTDE